ncbi:MAG: serine/threonine protein kinase, partial [Proteobacteria bacterium]|nr:serine/threonine protein kinase [Pseudomonadota bacterium]
MLEPGTTLHRGYAIDRVLGKGGMGIVYLAHQTALGNRRVALKEIIIPELDPAIRAELIAQFKREAAILGAIEHPNLVDVKDCFEENGAHFMVMAFI